MPFVHLPYLQLTSVKQRPSPVPFLFPQKEQMGAAQEELGAAGPCSDQSGGGVDPFHGGYLWHRAGSGPPAYMESLTKVGRSVPACRMDHW